MRRQRKARIIATLGPASSDPAMIEKLFDAGADVFRLNFSHGTQEDHKRRFDAIRALEARKKRPIGVLQDLQGPKIRIGTLKSGPVTLISGNELVFRLDREPGDVHSVALPHPEVFENMMPGHRIMIDDGKLQLECVGCEKDRIRARVVVGGVLSDRKGVNLPQTELTISPLTPKDRDDLAFGLGLGVDWVALSFVQRPSDVIEAQGLIKGRAGIMAKIEKPAALGRIEDIVALVDAVMVARGDLGVEIPPEDVPGRQKELIRLCRHAGKPVVVATQMLESMIKSPSPTRAEASDVATAIYDSADAVMLSAESASGDWPAEAVSMMSRIIEHTEGHKLYRSIIEALQPTPEDTTAHAVAAAAADIADSIGAAAIVAYTASGTTAMRTARKRPRVPILSLTSTALTARRLALLWGSHNVVSPEITNYDEMVDHAKAHALEEGFARPGDRIVIIAGIPFGRQGSTNNIRVARI
ncbi:MAG: pyruvate kinase [Hyphomicrobiaceae bacterium]|nr:pyruvate kinase [Hyphomicrobiaceae bacterium]